MDRLARFRQISRNIRTSTTIGLFICIVSALGLFIGSFFVPPMGQIDPSILKAGGLVFGFAALFELREAVLEGMGVKLTHGDTTISVGADDEDNDNES